MGQVTSFLDLVAPSSIELGTPLILRGEFKLAYAEAGTSARDEQVLKHIVMVVTRGGNYQTLVPFKDVVVFPEDVKRTENSVLGFFNLNLFDKIAFGGAGTYFILCSLGKHTSNVVSVEVKG